MEVKGLTAPCASERWAEYPQLEATIAIGRMRLDKQVWET